MRRFRQFLSESETVFPEITQANMPFSGSTRYSGHLQLPDLRNLHDPGHVPYSGYSNFGHLANTMIDKMKYGDVDTYIFANILEKIAALAENLVSAIVAGGDQPHNQGHLTIRYRTARYRPNEHLITGLPYRGIVANGGYPELRPQDVDVCLDKKILIEDPYRPDPKDIAAAGIDPKERFLAIDIDMLRSTMTNIKNTLVPRERGSDAAKHLIRTGQGIFNQMTGGGVMQPRKDLNPLG